MRPRPREPLGFWHDRETVHLKSSLGTTTEITDATRQHGAPFSVHGYALALARVRRKRGATEAMRKVAQYVAQVDQQVAALLPAAEQRGLDLFRCRRAREDQRTNARRRERLIEAIRRNAKLLTEEELVTAWREGVVEAVHRR